MGTCSLSQRRAAVLANFSPFEEPARCIPLFSKQMLSSLARRGLAVRSLPRLGTTTAGLSTTAAGLSSAPPSGVVGSHDHEQHIRDFKDLTGEACSECRFSKVAAWARHGSASFARSIVDSVSHEDALEVVRGMARKNAEGQAVSVLPYRIGINAAYVAAWASIPLVFSLQTAKKFNEVAVTTDVPEPADLNTMLEVGSWTWGWMEPPLGTISFFLLCLQYARDQKLNIGQQPWTTYWKEKQGDKLAAAYPQYHKGIVRDYGRETCFDDDSDDF